MNERHNEKRLDSLLDSLLASYSSVQPRPGFTQRLMATLQQSKLERRWFRSGGWNWGIAAAVAAPTALLLIAACVWWPLLKVQPRKANKADRQQLTTAAIEQSSAHASAKPHVIPDAEPKHTPRKQQNRQMASQMVPKLGVFPSPAPLTKQERLLLSYLAGTPREELIAQSHPDDLFEVNGQSSDFLPDRGQTRQGITVRRNY